MSWQAQQWAYEDAPMLLTASGKPDTTARAVLAVLAYHADEHGRNAHPSLVVIKHETGFNRDTAMGALRRLTAGGLIAEDGSTRGSYGAPGAKRWRLDITKRRPVGDLDELRAEEQARLQRSRRSSNSETEAEQNRLSEAEQNRLSEAEQNRLIGPTEADLNHERGGFTPRIEADQNRHNHQGNHQEPPLARASEDDTGGVLLHLPVGEPSKPSATAPDHAAEFEAFWLAYPKRKGQRVGKKNAVREYAKARKTATAEQLMAAVATYATTCNGFPKDAERFLRDEIWADLMHTSRPDPALRAAGPRFEGA